jgi:hypothetical protein
MPFFASQANLTCWAWRIFKLRAMLYDMVERWMTLFGEEVVPRIPYLLDHNVAGNRVATKPARRIV